MKKQVLLPAKGELAGQGPPWLKTFSEIKRTPQNVSISAVSRLAEPKVSLIFTSRAVLMALPFGFPTPG
jgi:hypothetical protein